MNEKLYKAIIISLGRLGIDTKKLEESEDPQITEDQIAEAVVNQDRYIKPKIDTEKKKVDAIIIGKMYKQAIDLGLDKDKVEETAGDIGKLFALVDTHVKAEAGKSDDEKSAKIKELQTQLREQELDLKKRNDDFTQERETIEANHQAAIQELESSYAVKHGMLGLNLADSIRENIGYHSQVMNHMLNETYDFKLVNGKRMAFKKGTEDPVYIEGSSNQADQDYLIKMNAEKLKLEKVTGVRGNGDPNQPNPNQPIPQQEEVYDRYE